MRKGVVVVFACWVVVLSTAQVHAQHDALQIARCRFEMANDITSTAFNLNPQLLSNALQMSFTNVLSGTVTATVQCMDSSSAVLYETSFMYEGSSLSQEAVLANLEPTDGQSAHVPFFSRFALAESPSEARAEVLARSFLGNEFEYAMQAISSSLAPLTPQQCSATSDACDATYPSSDEPIIFAVTATEQNTGYSAHVTGDKTALLAGNFHGAFNQEPVITRLGFDQSAVTFGTSITLTASFLDFDVSNVSASDEALAYAFTIDHVDASGTVITAGGGSMCSSGWLTLDNGHPLAGSVSSLGPAARVFTGTFQPSGSGVSRRCRITLTVTDWQDVTTSADVTVEVGSSVTSTGAVGVTTDAADALPFVFARQGVSEGIVTLFMPDKCDGVTCASETQCLQASICDSGTGTCLDQVPKTGQACDDGDDTTRDDTCTSQGVCVGTSKCLGVVCEPLSTCHNAGVCIPNLGACSPSTLKAAGEYCDDMDDTTVFDICDAVGNCQGTDVAELIRDDEVDFTAIAGADPVRLRSLLSSLPDVCCESEVCCQPCSSGACAAGDYDRLWYLQTDLA
ncbi:hypothetical protein PTSG_01851 [Salpingoeca rosetta]|uniref:Disintegrin domain-containing protein n=1 Tax=Salpingoeca rosetta (strain ATCC 50818 / BSB-021) TaxID=946362 RepID=F2TZ50_SALR5|nr:uncharacterized protein PTSG_01851 [Salpingoeca rosetta]EGD78874.1 hypothetical protein PTSG_01851 [Salpingoeca rosetta]|eukprot:XP_004997830.1 hypothetical protein PTSG_01851 [Salpingoeca rosetta]